MNNLKNVMKAKRVTKYQLSKITGISYPTLMAIEKGGDVKLSTLAKIANALGIKVKELLD